LSPFRNELLASAHFSRGTVSISEVGASKRKTYPSENTILKVMVDIGDIQLKMGFEHENLECGRR
jgi:hypothetical protein